jgi:RND family efflux transporter MFP subunit
MIRLLATALLAFLCTVTAVTAAPTALVQLARARQGILHPRVHAYGSVGSDPNSLVTIATPRDGSITSLDVRAGQLVRAGDPIVTIETAPAALANYRQAQSALSFAEKDLTHTQELFAEELATRSQLAAAEKAVTDARAQVVAQTSIGADMASEVVRAKSPGVVVTLSVARGDRVQANAALATVATQNRFVATLGLEPSDAMNVAPGNRVRMMAPQHAGPAIEGSIQSVDAMMDPKTRLTNAVVAIPSSASGGLYLGMVLDATIELAGTSGVIVPHASLMSDRNGSYLFVVSKGIAHRRNVRVGLQTDADALIERGVKAGEDVVVAGNAGVDDGTMVRVH